jgi:hypothetical protein
MATGMYEPPFNIKESVLFKEACLACMIAMERSRAAGVGVTRKKVGPASFVLVFVGSNVKYSYQKIFLSFTH